jgi:hypothetical protein
MVSYIRDGYHMECSSTQNRVGWLVFDARTDAAPLRRAKVCVIFWT